MREQQQTATPVTIGEISRLSGAPVWLIRRWYDTHKLPITGGRVGIYRIVTANELPAVLAQITELLKGHRRLERACAN